MTEFTAQHHQAEAEHHATMAEQALENMLERPELAVRKTWQQTLGVNLKLADIHARLALAAAQIEPVRVADEAMMPAEPRRV